jgi:hypothetical protein
MVNVPPSALWGSPVVGLQHAKQTNGVIWYLAENSKNMP